MSDTQKIVDTLNEALSGISDAIVALGKLPDRERISQAITRDFLIAAENRLERSLAAHSNALVEVT